MGSVGLGRGRVVSEYNINSASALAPSFTFRTPMDFLRRSFQWPIVATDLALIRVSLPFETSLLATPVAAESCDTSTGPFCNSRVQMQLPTLLCSKRPVGAMFDPRQLRTARLPWTSCHSPLNALPTAPLNFADRMWEHTSLAQRPFQYQCPLSSCKNWIC